MKFKKSDYNYVMNTTSVAILVHQLQLGLVMTSSVSALYTTTVLAIALHDVGRSTSD